MRLKSYLAEARYELIKTLRIPMFVIPALAFPLMFYVLFGILLGGGRQAGSISMSTYMLAAYGAFGVVGVALFSFGVGVAVERGQGWLQVKRASPMPPTAYFFAKMVVSLIFSGAVVALLFLVAFTAGGVRLPAGTAALLAVTLITGAIPFNAMGLALGYLAGPNSAPAVVNLIYLPMSFASGLWIPIHALPEVLRSSAPVWPAYHFGQVAFAAIGASDGSTLPNAAALAGFTVVFLLAALFGMRRDEGKTYG
jgi:ABC-2 type transport system permease protein